MALLDAKGVTLQFGGLRALDDVSMHAEEGELYGIIGPNGAGKTSLLNCINGFYRPQAGRIEFQGVNLVGMRPHRIAERGIARTFQNVELFRDVPVLDNVLMGRHTHLPQSFLSCLFFSGRARSLEIGARRRVEEILELMNLGRYRHEPVGNLPYGKQKLVEIARALAMEPTLLLLDEPTSGMTHDEKQTVANVMLEIQSSMKVTQVLIEHDVKFVSDLCDRIVVLDFGHQRSEGPPARVLAEPEVIAAYIGAKE